MHELTSIIICTYNRSALLARLLDSLARQQLDHERFEVIVICDGSTDDTDAVCGARLQALPNFRTIKSAVNHGLAHARNLGIAAAGGDKLLFTDDDCIPETEWAEGMVRALEEHPVVAGAIASPETPYLTLAHNVAHFHRFLPHRPGGVVPFMAGANMGFRRSVLVRLAGFDEGCVHGEDTEMALRLRANGTDIVFEPRAVVRHDPSPRKLAELLAYAARHAAVTIHLRHRFGKLLATPRVLNSAVILVLASPLIAAKTVFQIYRRGPWNTRFLSTLPVVFATKLAWCFGAARGLRAGSTKQP